MVTEKEKGINILSADAAQRKIRRLAFEIAESNSAEKSLVIAGINGNGAVLARKISDELKAILDIHIEEVLIDIDKANPADVSVTPQRTWRDKVIIIVDDVCMSGKTLLYSIKPFLQTIPKKIQTLVLVERSHKQFSIHPDYVGLNISTTLQEHILVKVSGDRIEGAWLH